MTLSDLASLGSFVSGAAVLVSLLYLALQVRQSKQHTAAQISQARHHAGMQQQELYVADPAVAELFFRGLRGDRDLSDVDAFRLSFLFTNTFMMIEDDFRQYKAGLIPAERHDGFVKRLSRGLQQPGYRAAWILQRDGFEPDFQAYMDALVQRARENGSLWSPSKVWQAVIAAEVEGQSPPAQTGARMTESAT